MITLQDLIDKRVRSWNDRHDLEFADRQRDMLIAYLFQKGNEHLVKELREKPHLLVELAFNIVNKDKETTPFIVNEVQQEFKKALEQYKRGKFLVLKGRQQGFTTYITAVQLANAIVKHNFSGFTIADTTGNAQDILKDKAKAVFERLPECLKPTTQYNSKNEMYFSKLNSSWRISAATDNIGRSKTLNFLHLSEAAFFQCNISELEAGIGETLTKNAIEIFESTANGHNQFKELWDSGTCINLFYEWWKTSEYRDEDTYLINEVTNEWLLARLEWLRHKGLDDEQLAWYVKKYNGYLDKEKIKQEYPCTPEEAFISSGNCVFNADEAKARIDLIREAKPSRRGRFAYTKRYDNIGHYVLENVRWVEDPNGIITIHEEPYQEEETDNGKADGHKTGRVLKKPYTIGGDTAGDGSDYFTAKVIDNRNLTTVATLRCQKIDDDQYGEQMACLGHLYHDALIGIEVNFSIVANNTLLALDYPNIYRRERVDTLTNIMEQKVGFATTSKTRPQAIGDLVAIERDSAYMIENDIDTLKEMLTFVKNEKGRQEASQGSHDDLVMALAIAHQCRIAQGQVEWIVEGEIFDITSLFEDTQHYASRHASGNKWRGR